MSDHDSQSNPSMGRLTSLLEQNRVEYRILVSSPEPEETSKTTTSIKTLVWEASPRTIGHSPRELHYFLTALESTKRVDEEALTAFVESSLCHGNKMDIRLAETATAELLTGCIKGAIPPFGHAFPKMDMYIDEAIMSCESSSVSVGSGSVGFDLVISKTDMLQLCHKTTRVHLCQISHGHNASATVAPTSTPKIVISAAKESRSVNRSTQNLGKRLRNASGKRGKADEVRQIMEEMGDTFPNFLGIGTDGNFTKNALHLAAWKGDLESIQLIADKGTAFGLDLVNTISTGQGNYGKTPIFYSITQCRDDAVVLLVELGSNLLIVNNKGQTPCSMAPSHLSATTCDYLYNVEAKQLKKCRTFENYRITHSDGQRYGDLDPRFSIDKENMGADIVDEITAYRQALRLLNGDEPPDMPRGSGFPRSLRQTTRQSRERGLGNRVKTARKVEYDKSIELQPGRQEARAPSKRKKATAIAPAPIIDVTHLKVLKLKDVLRGDAIVVDGEEGLQELSRCIELSLSMNTSDHQHETEKQYYPSDELIAKHCWGLDCEWKPAYEKGEDHPVATLQLGTLDFAFLVDVQELCQANIRTSDFEMTDTERKLSKALSRLFTDPNTAIAGFGIGQDLSKLAMSFPHLPCFQLFASVIDVQHLSTNAFPGTRKDYIRSLQTAVAVLAEKRLDKSEQISNWQRRPLLNSQVEYALLDAIMSCWILSLMVEKIGKLECWEGFFFRKHSHLRSTIRIQFLDCPTEDERPMAYRVSMGTVRQILSVRFSRQTWPTGKEPPPLPVCIPLEEAPRPPRKTKQHPRSTQEKDNPSNSRPLQSKKKGVLLSTLPGDHENLPPVGVTLGWTKDSCVERILSKQVQRTMPNDFKLQYNRWGGVIQMSNTWLLFIKFAGQEVHGSKYRNEFCKDGRQVTFSVNPDRLQERELVEFLTTTDNKNDTKVLLFARPDNRNQFMFCGECKCHKHTPTDIGVTLHLELVDYEMLMSNKEGMWEQLVRLKQHGPPPPID